VQTIPLHAQLSTGEECFLLVPVHLPPSILTHPVFKEGYEWGYLESNPEEEQWTVPEFMNDIYHQLAELRPENESDFYPWTLGFLLGELASVAERNKTLALTGLAHFCFLLPLLTQDRPPSWHSVEPHHAGILHRRAMKAYRARVRVYREQGASFPEAQRLALAGSIP
jgi:hypothetical protein